MFQQDNDSKHTPTLVMKWIKQANIELKTSPNLNPIENMWIVLKSQICAKN